MLISDITRKFSITKPKSLPADSKINLKERSQELSLDKAYFVSTVTTQDATALILRVAMLFRLERTYGAHVVQAPSSSRISYNMLAMSSWILSISTNGDSKTPVGNLFQCLTTLTVKNFFLCSDEMLYVFICIIVFSPITGHYWEDHSFLIFIPSHP